MNIHQNSIDSYNDEKGKGRPGSYRRKIVDLLESSPKASFTDRGIMCWLDVTEKSNISPEVTRLVRRGLIIETGKTKCPSTGKKVRKVCIERRKKDRI